MPRKAGDKPLGALLSEDELGHVRAWADSGGVRHRAAQRRRFPDELLVINYLCVPLSGTALLVTTMDTRDTAPLQVAAAGRGGSCRLAVPLCGHVGAGAWVYNLGTTTASCP